MPLHPHAHGLKFCVMITATFLSNNYLTGELPKVLYNFSNLIELDIWQNGFIGALPNDIDRLSLLKSVDFGSNNFTGDIPPTIDLSSLGLVSLFNKYASPKIPPEFGNLSSMCILDMSENDLIRNVPETIANLSNLEMLDLSSNRLEGEIPARLFLLKSLHYLYLYENYLSGKIPLVIDCVKLVEIDISMNGITGSIPEEFGKLKRLKVLNLFTNQLSGNIPISISHIPTLMIFQVSRNNLGGELPSNIGLLLKLEVFNVSENNLTGEISRSLESCHSLKNIKLQYNGFTGEFPFRYLDIFNLSSVSLTKNSISGELPSKVAWNLSRLDVSENRFSGQIPEEISFDKNAHVFKAIMDEIRFREASPILYDAHGNSLSSKLPSDMTSWSSLLLLNLARNNLYGPMPIVSPVQQSHSGSTTAPPGSMGLTIIPGQFVRNNNCTIEFDVFGFSVKDFKTRRVLLRCDSTGNLYLVTAPSPIPHAFLVSQHTWHQRLGHPGHDVLRNLVSNNVISCNNEKPPVRCHACQLGKHVRLSFVSSNTVITSCFDIIHSDLWTSITESSGLYCFVTYIVEQLIAWSGMDMKMAKTCYHSHVSLWVKTVISSLVSAGADTAYLLLYVDDIVLTASSEILMQEIIRSLHQEFAMIDLGPLNYFLGISVTRDSSGLFLSQKKYVIEILERAHMVNCNPSRTPVDTESKLGGDGNLVSDLTLYQSLAGSLQYLTFTRHDISYAVQQVCLYMHDPWEPHFAALKRILRYISGTLAYGL
ncbi:receptor-like protein kinase HSL1 [Tanacetum coccineum]